MMLLHRVMLIAVLMMSLAVKVAAMPVELFLLLWMGNGARKRLASLQIN